MLSPVLEFYNNLWGARNRAGIGCRTGPLASLVMRAGTTILFLLGSNSPHRLSKFPAL
jgi:hypothetical protein